MAVVVTTKKQLAAELGITPSRVSQYVRDGLPVRLDGKINHLNALNWVKSNVAGDAGVVAARLLSTKSESGPVDGAHARATDAALMALARKIVRSAGALVGISSHLAGADRALAARTGEIASIAFLLEISDWLAACGVEPVASDPDGDIWPDPDADYASIDWSKLGPPGEMELPATE